MHIKYYSATPAYEKANAELQAYFSGKKLSKECLLQDSNSTSKVKIPIESLPEAIKENFLTISVLLRDETVIRKVVVEMEREFLEKYGDNATVKNFQTYLEDSLADYGFSKFGKVMDALEPFEFRATIEAGMLLQDIGYGAESEAGVHGEFSHAFQWLLIAKANEIYPKNSLSFNKPVVEVFKDFSREEAVCMRKMRSSEVERNAAIFEKSAWDLIVDRLPNNIDNFDYSYNEAATDLRSPADVIPTLRRLNACPTISKLLEQRVEKRNADKANGVSMQKKYESPHPGYHQSKTIKNLHEPDGVEINTRYFIKCF
jgi:hypothetical protein